MGVETSKQVLYIERGAAGFDCETGAAIEIAWGYYTDGTVRIGEGGRIEVYSYPADPRVERVQGPGDAPTSHLRDDEPMPDPRWRWVWSVEARWLDATLRDRQADACGVARLQDPQRLIQLGEAEVVRAELVTDLLVITVRVLRHRPIAVPLSLLVGRSVFLSAPERSLGQAIELLASEFGIRTPGGGS